MSETITIEAPGLSGDTGLTLYLRSQVDNSLLNTGGDALAETSGSQGLFTTTLDESRASGVTYRMIVEDTAGVVWYDWLDPGETRNREALAASSGGGSGDASQDTLEEVLATANQIKAKTQLITGDGVNVVAPVTQTGVLRLGIGTDDVGRWKLPVKVAAGASLRSFLQSNDVALVQFIAAREGRQNEIVIDIDPDDIPAPAEDGSIEITVEIPRSKKPNAEGQYNSGVYVKTTEGLWHDETASTLYLSKLPGKIPS